MKRKYPVMIMIVILILTLISTLFDIVERRNTLANSKRGIKQHLTSVYYLINNGKVDEVNEQINNIIDSYNITDDNIKVELELLYIRTKIANDITNNIIDNYQTRLSEVKLVIDTYGYDVYTNVLQSHNTFMVFTNYVDIEKEE